MTDFEDLPLCFTEGAIAATIPEDARHGLSEVEAVTLLGTYGKNELPEDAPQTLLEIILNTFKEPMFALLAICAVIYIIAGDHDEAIMLSSFVIFIIGITIVQERRTESALSSLKGLAPQRALTVRGGRARLLEVSLLVPGDIVCITEGDHVPADGVVIAECGLMVDESLLTGESQPIHKSAGDGHVLSGTSVVSGSALCRVEKTGVSTQIGVIGASIAALGDEKTPLDKEVSNLVQKMGIVAGCACLLTFFAYGILHSDWMRAALTALSLAMGLLPEEFPVVLSVFVTIGALRMSYCNVLVRKNKAVETLSCCDVVCTDKTGTLTTNNMVVHSVTQRNGVTVSLNLEPSDAASNPIRELDSTFYKVLKCAELAGQVMHDPMHAAVLDALQHTIPDNKEDQLSSEKSHANWKLIREYPFTRTYRMSTFVWDSHEGDDYIIASKGSPESILPLCRDFSSQAEKDSILNTATTLSDKGLRVLAIARGKHPSGSQLPANHTEFAFEFVGLLAFLNPLRQTARKVIQEMQNAGIRVMMITGDAPGTARFIAEDCGIVGNSNTCGSKAITGDDINSMNVQQLSHSAMNCPVFARVLPQHKLAIVQALKQNGHVVSMLGDGVNDAPALKAAHVGVAMGKRGTEVAREASDLVLLDDDLGSLTQAVRMGRRIRDNMVKAMGFIIAVHVPLCLMVVLPVLFGWQNIFYPAHIVCMELIIDPTCSIVLESEPEEEDIMSRPPTNPNAHLVTLKSFFISLLQGLVIVFIALSLYRVCVGHDGMPLESANACTFCMVVVASIGLIVVNRSSTKTILTSYKRKNIPLFILIVVVTFVLGIMFHSPHIAHVMHFTVLKGHHVFHSILWGIISVSWYEVYKYVKYERHTTATTTTCFSNLSSTVAYYFSRVFSSHRQTAASGHWDDSDPISLEEGRGQAFH